MAKAEVQLPEGLLTRLSQLGAKSDEIAEKMLEAGGEVLLSRVKSNLAGVIGKGTKYPSESTGELERSLGLSPAKLDRNGNHNIKVGFSEPRADGSSNAISEQQSAYSDYTVVDEMANYAMLDNVDMYAYVATNE